MPIIRNHARLLITSRSYPDFWPGEDVACITKHAPPSSRRISLRLLTFLPPSFSHYFSLLIYIFHSCAENIETSRGFYSKVSIYLTYGDPSGRHTLCTSFSSYKSGRLGAAAILNVHKRGAHIFPKWRARDKKSTAEPAPRKRPVYLAPSS